MARRRKRYAVEGTAPVMATMPRADLRPLPLRLSVDPYIMRLFGESVRIDTDYQLYYGGKSWSDLYDVLRDPQWLAAWTQRRAESCQAEWEVRAWDPGDEREQEIADAVWDMLQRLHLETVREAVVQAVPCGYSVQEVMWARRGGMIVPGEILSKPPWWFDFDINGALLFNDGGVTYRPVADRKFLLSQHGADENNPYGNKLASVLYSLVWVKRHAWKFGAVFLEKFSVPAILAHYARTVSEQDRAALQDAIEQWGVDQALLIPEEAKVSILANSNASGQHLPHAQMIAEVDRIIAKVVLGGSLTLEAGSDGGRGTRALGGVHRESLDLLVSADSRLIEQTLGTLIRWIVDYNWGPQENYPEFRNIVDRDELDTERNENLREWYKLGLPVALESIYEAAQLDPPADDAEILEPPPSPPPPPPDGVALARGPGGSSLSAFAAGPGPGPIERAARAAEAYSERVRVRAEDVVLAAHAGAFEPLVADFRAMSRAADGLDAMAQAVGAYEIELQTDQMQQAHAMPAVAGVGAALGNVRLLGRLYGLGRMRAEIQAQVDAEKFSGRLQYDDRAELVADVAWDQDPQAVLDRLAARYDVAPEAWATMQGVERAAVWSYAYAPCAELVTEVKGMIQNAAARGTSFYDFQVELEDAYIKRGLIAPLAEGGRLGQVLAPWYVETVFRTTLFDAYGAARWRQMRESRDYIHYCEWVTAGDQRVRPSHAALEGVYRIDDIPARPPIDYKCRCLLIGITEGRRGENNYTIREDADLIGSTARGGFGGLDD